MPKLYFWSLLVASFSVAIACILAMTRAALTLARPSQFSGRACVAGAFFYWIFIAGSLLISFALGIHFSFRYMTVWDVIQYLMGCAAAIVAYAIYSQNKVRGVL